MPLFFPDSKNHRRLKSSPDAMQTALPCEAINTAKSFAKPTAPTTGLLTSRFFAKMKFRQKERQAIESIHKVWGHGVHDVRLVFLGFGDADTFPDCQPLRNGTIWESLTPFVATRHPKTRRDGRPKLDENGWHIGSPEHDLHRLLTQQGFPAPEKIERLEKFVKINQRKLRPPQFQTFRQTGDGLRAIHPPVGFRITFPRRVDGPIGLGYYAHYGLGLFRPDKSECVDTKSPDV